MYVAGNGGNDVIMMGFALLAVYFGLQGRWRLSFPMLALASLVKFVCVLLVPIFLLYALLVLPRNRWRTLVEPLTVSTFLALALYLPFWRGQVTFSTLRYQASQFTDSPPAFLLRLLFEATPAHAEVLTKGPLRMGTPGRQRRRILLRPVPTTGMVMEVSGSERRYEEKVVDFLLELADVLFTVIALANSTGVDLEASFDDVMEKYRRRDAGRYRA